jgi:microcystin-dependent protein
MDPFLGEIKLISWNYPPRNWAFCDGATMSIATNQALFALLGTTYGGDGIRTFALPDLRGRTPVGQGPASTIGTVAGEALHQLTNAEVPAHTHPVFAAQAAGTTDTNPSSGGDWLSGLPNGYAPPGNAGQLGALDPSVITPTGQNLPHENRQPFLCLNYMIALAGIFPSRS